MAKNMESISEELKILKRIESLLTDSETDTESQTSDSTTSNKNGITFPKENIACSELNALVLKGENPNALLNGDSLNYDTERGYTYHYTDEGWGQGILIRLGKKYGINHMKMLLCDKDLTSYSYYIEVSIDCREWYRVVDYTSYLCRSWQWLFFAAKVVKYIRIVGTRTTKGREFKVVSFECMFTNRVAKIERGLLAPKVSVATIGNNVTVIEGSNGKNLINGNYKDNLNAYHLIGKGCIVVQLCQPFLIDSMSLLLWNKDRKYSYYVEVSVDQQNWLIVADKRRELCSSWQVLTFTKKPVVFIRITGTYCSADDYFRCVHFECPQQELENTK